MSLLCQVYVFCEVKIKFCIEKTKIVLILIIKNMMIYSDCIIQTQITTPKVYIGSLPHLFTQECATFGANIRGTMSEDKTLAFLSGEETSNCDLHTELTLHPDFQQEARERQPTDGRWRR